MAKSILITGCSTGIGFAAAEILHQKGYRVFASARKRADVEKLRALGVESLQLDVDDSASIQAALNTVLERTDGTLDALFNNAGYAIPGAIEDLTRDMLRQQFETNVFGPMELVQRVLPIMRRQGHGRIIQNTSILGVITMPYRGNYNASKFALEGFSSTLRQELRGTPIHVSIIAPGPIATQFRNTAYRQFQETLQGKPSNHQTTYQHMEKQMHDISAVEKSVTLSSAAVVKKVLHALESRSPHARYYVGLPAHVFAFLRRILPDSALDWVITRSLG